MSLTMSSKDSEYSFDDAFPPTDFREFIDKLQGANAAGQRFLASMVPCLPQSVLSTEIEVQAAQRSILIIETLLARRRDLNAHYGWILAADATLVYRSIGGKSENGAAWTRQWMKAVWDEYERVGQALLTAKLELEVFAMVAESDGKSGN